MSWIDVTRWVVELGYLAVLGVAVFLFWRIRRPSFRWFTVLSAYAAFGWVVFYFAVSVVDVTEGSNLQWATLGSRIAHFPTIILMLTMLSVLRSTDRDGRR